MADHPHPNEVIADVEGAVQLLELAFAWDGWFYLYEAEDWRYRAQDAIGDALRDAQEAYRRLTEPPGPTTPERGA